MNEKYIWCTYNGITMYIHDGYECMCKDGILIQRVYYDQIDKLYTTYKHYSYKEL